MKLVMQRKSFVYAQRTELPVGRRYTTSRLFTNKKKYMAAKKKAKKTTKAKSKKARR